jgi:hypothetical protein
VRGWGTEEIIVKNAVVYLKLVRYTLGPNHLGGNHYPTLKEGGMARGTFSNDSRIGNAGLG